MALTLPTVTGEASFPQLLRTKVASVATSVSGNRDAKPGMPSREGAPAVTGDELPTRIKRMSEVASADSTVELPAIAGNTRR